MRKLLCTAAFLVLPLGLFGQSGGGSLNPNTLAGGASLLDVGTTAGTVAAGDDGVTFHFVGTGNVVVSGAGTTAVDGTYEPNGTANGKTKYALVGGTPAIDFIIWSGSAWEIDNGTVNRYRSPDLVATPDLVTTWTATFGDAPVPAVDPETDESIISVAGRALVTAADAAAQRTLMGLVIGTNVQAADAQLDAVSGNVRHVFIPAWMFGPRVTAGAQAGYEEYATNDVNVDHYLFAGDATEGIQLMWPVPWDYDQGTIKAKVYWDAATGASAADTVEWDISGGSLANDDAIDTALGTAQASQDVVIAVGDLHVSPASAAITIAGTPAAGDLILLQIERDHDGTDDMTEDAKFLGLVIEYTPRTTAPTAW